MSSSTPTEQTATLSEKSEQFDIYVFKKRHSTRRPVWYQFGRVDCQNKAIRQARLLRKDKSIERVEIHCRPSKCNCANDDNVRKTKPVIMRRQLWLGLERLHEMALFILAISISTYLFTWMLL